MLAESRSQAEAEMGGGGGCLEWFEGALCFVVLKETPQETNSTRKDKNSQDVCSRP